MTDFQPDIPQQTDQLLQCFGQFLIGLRRQEEKEVDIGIRPEQAATVTTDGDESQRFRQTHFLPEFAQHFVDQLAARVQHA